MKTRPRGRVSKIQYHHEKCSSSNLYQLFSLAAYHSDLKSIKRVIYRIYKEWLAFSQNQKKGHFKYKNVQCSTVPNRSSISGKKLIWKEAYMNYFFFSDGGTIFSSEHDKF